MKGLACAALLAAASAAPAAACRFVSRPFAKSLADAGRVFTGVVVDARPVDPASPFGEIAIRFRVDRWWRGGSSRSLTVYTDGSSCGLRAAPNQRWLILAAGSPPRSGLPSGSVLLRLEDGRGAGNALPAELTKTLGAGRAPK